MSLPLACVASFLIGAIPTAFLFVKFLKGTDIRQVGSGNVGATNASRVLGKKMGFVVFAIDFLKGFFPVILFSRLLGFPPSDFSAFALIGFCAIFGHVFNPFLGFKAGKGIATGGGVLAASFPLIFVAAIAVWGFSFLLTKIVSLSSILAGIALPVLSLIFHHPPSIQYAFLFLAIFGLWAETWADHEGDSNQ